MVELPRGDVHLFYGGTPTRRRTPIIFYRMLIAK
jgi:hypothetical protein